MRPMMYSSPHLYSCAHLGLDFVFFFLRKKNEIGICSLKKIFASVAIWWLTSSKHPYLLHFNETPCLSTQTTLSECEWGKKRKEKKRFYLSSLLVMFMRVRKKERENNLITCSQTNIRRAHFARLTSYFGG